MALLNVSFDAVSEAHLHDLVSTRGRAGATAHRGLHTTAMSSPHSLFHRSDIWPSGRSSAQVTP